MATFGQRKAQCLARADASRRGALDERAVAVVQLLNGRSRFCTTSSCSGRLVLAQSSAAMTALGKATGDVVLKFEPFVLHVLCQELQDAQLLHSVAIESGFRNSGITVGRGGKIMMAVRSTHCLEVPLSRKGKLMVSEEYIEFLVHVANGKMEENTRRIDRFYQRLELALNPVASARAPPEGTGEGRPMYVRRRKRRTVPERGAHASAEDHGEELEPEDDAESELGILAEVMV
ncbi:tRNA wybutosine-synthesizing protein 3 homolog isoform 2-T2 [Rhynochetos jubatus]